MSSRNVLSGKLGFLSLGDVLQLVGSNGGTGILRIMSKYSPQPGQIYFSKGNLINASAGGKTGLDAAYSLFGWIDGEFEFSLEDVNVSKEINTPRMEIILDGLRMVDDGITKKLGPVSIENVSNTSSGKAESVPVIKGPLVDYIYVVDEEEFRSGQKIVQENSHGSWIWSILEGNVDIVKETSLGPVTMHRLGPGSYIGTISSFFQNSKRHTTAVAIGNVQLGVLDIQRLSKEFSAFSREFREFSMSFDHRLQEVFDRVVAFHLKKDIRKSFTQGMKIAMKQGKKDDKLFRIKQGEAAIVRETPDGYIPLIKLTSGDYVGQLPFADFGHEPHAASVFATKNFGAEKMDTEQLQKEFDQIPSVIRNMIENISTSISITTRMACELHKKNILKKEDAKQEAKPQEEPNKK